MGQVVPGKGLRCRVDGKDVAIGNRLWLGEQGVSLSVRFEDSMQVRLGDRCCAIMYV
jgi:cation transport ATPase